MKNICYRFLSQNASTNKAILSLTILGLIKSKAAAQTSSSSFACGPDTFLEDDVCHCDRNVVCANAALENNTIFLAGILDTKNYPWAKEVFELVARLINNHTDGWHDDVLDDGTVFDFQIANS